MMQLNIRSVRIGLGILCLLLRTSQGEGITKTYRNLSKISEGFVPYSLELFLELRWLRGSGGN